jgi:hypothetical protein
MLITGAYELTPPQCTCRADLSGSPDAPSLAISANCSAPGLDDISLTAGIDINAATPLGTYPDAGGYLEVGNSSDPVPIQLEGKGTCTVNLQAFAPATRGGLTAHVTCSDLEDSYEQKHVGVTAEIALLPAAAEPPGDAGFDAPGAPSSVDGGPQSTCSMKVTGAYSMQAVDTAPSVWDANVQCDIQGTDLEAMMVVGSGSSPGWLWLRGRAWCDGSCTSQYGGACALTATRNDGVTGGRFTGSFECPALVAADATQVAVSASLDAVIGSPPQ